MVFWMNSWIHEWMNKWNRILYPHPRVRCWIFAKLWLLPMYWCLLILCLQPKSLSSTSGIYIWNLWLDFLPTDTPYSACSSLIPLTSLPDLLFFHVLPQSAQSPKLEIWVSSLAPSRRSLSPITSSLWNQPAGFQRCCFHHFCLDPP